MGSQLHPPAAPPGLPAGAVSDVVEETVVVGGRPLRLLRPRDGDAVLDELLAEDDPDEDRLPFWTSCGPAAPPWPRPSPPVRWPAGGCWSWAAASAWSG
jgi:hypothetical protein